MKKLELENIHIARHQEDENVVDVSLYYPRNSPINTVELDLVEVRAADQVRVHYDFERNGWVMSQPRQYYVPIEDESFDLEVEWIESAFCPAWQYELTEDEKERYTPANKENHEESQ